MLILITIFTEYSNWRNERDINVENVIAIYDFLLFLLLLSLFFFKYFCLWCYQRPTNIQFQRPENIDTTRIYTFHFSNCITVLSLRHICLQIFKEITTLSKCIEFICCYSYTIPVFEAGTSIAGWGNWPTNTGYFHPQGPIG